MLSDVGNNDGDDDDVTSGCSLLVLGVEGLLPMVTEPSEDDITFSDGDISLPEDDDDDAI